MNWFDEAEELLAKKKKYEEENQKAAARYWNEFTPRARQAFSFATKEATDTKASCIGVEHLLVGLLALGDGVPFHILRNHGLTQEVVRAEVIKLNGGRVVGVQNPPYNLHTTPRLNRVLAAAKKEATALSHTYVGTDALLLALLAEPEGVAHRIFKTASIDPTEMREEILRQIKGTPDF